MKLLACKMKLEGGGLCDPCEPEVWPEASQLDLSHAACRTAPTPVNPNTQDHGQGHYPTGRPSFQPSARPTPMPCPACFIASAFDSGCPWDSPQSLTLSPDGTAAMGALGREKVADTFTNTALDIGLS